MSEAGLDKETRPQMVATWNIAADAGYYAGEMPAQGSYYVGGREPPGVWYAPDGDFMLVDGALVDAAVFERLYRGVDSHGRAIVTGLGGKGRTPAFDVTFSAPRSVALIWALASPELRAQIEATQLRAVRAALGLLEREATFARRGHNGQRLEPVALTAALFQHGESRPAEHTDGKVFADPNLHTHAVVINMATRADGTVGALYSIAQRDLKLATGSSYHAQLSAGLQELGFEIDRIGKNGIFEIAGVDEAVIEYFSARRHQIEAELAEHGVTSGEAVTLASAIAKSTRVAKDEMASTDRDEVWREAAESSGIDVSNFAEFLRHSDFTLDADRAERLLAERLADLPSQLTAQRSVFERKDLLAAIGAALVGTGLPASRIETEAQRLIDTGAVLAIGTDRLERTRYTTPEILLAERQLSEVSTHLLGSSGFALSHEVASAACATAGLSDEQTAAVLIATAKPALAVIAGAPGSGKSTTLEVIAGGYRAAGHRVVGSASAWRVANSLRDELGIESRAIASWLETARNGHDFLKHGDVLIVDEAGLVDLHSMGALLHAVGHAGAKIVLVGDPKQLQPIGGPALSVVMRSVEAARVESIVRQHDPWARDAIRDFGNGRADKALTAFANRGCLVEADGPAATVKAVVEAWRQGRRPGDAPLLVTRTNAELMATSRAVREVLREEGKLTGPEATFPAVTPSGHSVSLSIARGDQVRFLVRNDKHGVVNGTVASILGFEQHVTDDGGTSLEVEAEVSGRRVRFALSELADEKGRARLGWAYASTVYQSQGMTVDNAVVVVDHRYDRHQIYVAASRARQRTTLVIDGKAIDRQLAGDLPVGQQQRGFSPEARRTWLAERLSRAGIKESALEVLAAHGVQEKQAGIGASDANGRSRAKVRSREVSLG